METATQARSGLAGLVRRLMTRVARAVPASGQPARAAGRDTAPIAATFRCGHGISFRVMDHG